MGYLALLVGVKAHATVQNLSTEMIGGSNLANIEARFPLVVAANIAHSKGATLAKLTAEEITTLAWLDKSGAIYTAVKVYAPAYTSRFALARATAKSAFPQPPSTTIFNTLQEIYLDFRTAPVGSLGVGEALLSTTVYAGVNLTAAATGGYLVGGYVGELIQKYDPTLWERIGGTIDYIVNTELPDTAAKSAIALGLAEATLTNYFGLVAEDLGSGGGNIGDFGILDNITYVEATPYCLDPASTCE